MTSRYVSLVRDTISFLTLEGVSGSDGMCFL